MQKKIKPVVSFLLIARIQFFKFFVKAVLRFVQIILMLQIIWQDSPEPPIIKIQPLSIALERGRRQLLPAAAQILIYKIFGLPVVWQ